MDAHSAKVWRDHLSACSECGRYDRVYRRGVKLLAAQAEIEPSNDFFLQLQQRLSAEDRRAARPASSMAAAGLAVAAMLAFVAWLPVFMLADSNNAAVAAMQPTSVVSAEIAWHGERAVEERAPTHIHLARRAAWSPSSAGHVIEPKYTPVIFESPTDPPTYNR